MVHKPGCGCGSCLPLSFFLLLLCCCYEAESTNTSIADDESEQDDPHLRTAGSFTVFPVAVAWNGLMPENFSHSIERSDTSDGGRRICIPEHYEIKADIGLMARDWVASEALRLDDGATLECYNQADGSLTGRRVTQLEVALDGLAIVVARDGAGHSCLTNPEVGGLSMAQLRWIFSSSSDDDLANEGLDLASIAPNDDGDGIREWSDIHSSCNELPIHPYGVNSGSGTFHFFTSRVLGKDSLNSCNESEMMSLDALSDAEATDLLKNRRNELGGFNCYVGSEAYETTKRRLIDDGAGITYFGFGFYSRHSSELTVSRIADDSILGIADTEQAKVAPDTYSIVDGSYAMLARSLYMNVRNSAWDSAREFLLNGFSEEGTAAVSKAGYIPVNAAVRARMLQRIRRGPNLEADYIPVPPESCPLGTGLAIISYTNAHGNQKQNYSCLACSPGRFKSSDAATPCDECFVGTASEVSGRSACHACPRGTFANSTGKSSCYKCEVGTYAQNAGSFSCSDCSAGRVQGMQGQTACVECSFGHHQPLKGQGECLPCKPGSYASHSGQASCDLCSPGHHQEAAASNESCPRCSLGFYAVGYGAKRCESCPTGLTTQYLGAADISQCLCSEGTFMSMGKNTSSSSPCERCPPGMICPIGSAHRYLPTEGAYECPKEVLCNYPLVKTGYMTLYQEPLKVYKCSEVIHCPGGAPGQCGQLRSAENIACGRCMDNPRSYTLRDECIECNGLAQRLITMCAGIVCVGALAFTVIAVNEDEIKQSMSFIVLATIGGLTLTGMQAIGVFSNLNITWFEPLRSILRGMTVVIFDLGGVRVSCHLGNSPVTTYLARQLVAPSVVPLSWVVLMVKRHVVKRPMSVRLELINAVGALYSVFFIAVCVSALGPWICYEHPGRNGYSVVSMPSVLCFQSDEWIVLMTIACAALVTVVVPFLSMVIFAIREYPTAMQKNKSHYHKCFRFVFARFTAQRYYYLGFLMVRNLSIVCIPMINDNAIQMLMMCGVLLLFEVISASLRPWRAPIVNFYDISYASLLVLILISGTVQSDIYGSVSETSMATLGTTIFVATILLTLAGIAKAIADRFCRTCAYDAFLCHHKAAAGAQARYLKITWRDAQPQARIFIDSDDLLQLDDLFEIIRLHVSRIVVFLTHEALCRPWCCGEIITARMNSVQAAVVVASDLQISLLDTADCIQACFEDSVLMQYHVMPHDAEDAYGWLLGDEVPKLDVAGYGPGTRCLVMACNNLLDRTASVAGTYIGDGGDPIAIMQDCGHEVYYVISSDPLDDEASASAGILAAKVARIANLPWSALLCLADWPSLDRGMVRALVQCARATVVILTVNSMQSLDQMRVIVHTAASGNHALPLTTPLFIFPTDASLERASGLLESATPAEEETLSIPMQSVSTGKSVSRVGTGTGTGKPAELVKSFFRTIALGLGTHSSEKIIDTQCMEIAARMCCSRGSGSKKLKPGSSQVARRNNITGSAEAGGSKNGAPGSNFEAGARSNVLSSSFDTAGKSNVPGSFDTGKSNLPSSFDKAGGHLPRSSFGTGTFSSVPCSL